jgi:hypothetical protein
LSELSNNELEYLKNKNIIEHGIDKTDNKNIFTILPSKYWNDEIFMDLRKFSYGDANFKQYFGDMNLCSIYKYILNTFFTFQHKFETDMLKIYDSINIKDKYISIHVRRGDKINENPYCKLIDYVNIIKKNETKNVFIMTDDVSIIDDFKNILPDDYTIFSNENNNLNGFELCKLHTSSNTFENCYSKEVQYNILCNLFAEIKIAEESELFIGDFRSHVSVFICLKDKINNKYKNVILTTYDTKYVLLRKCFPYSITINW